MFSRKACKKYRTDKALIITIFVWLCVLITLGACNPTPQTTSQKPTEMVLGLDETSTINVATPEGVLETHAPVPTVTATTELVPSSIEPVATPSQTIQTTLETETGDITLTTTFEPASAKLTGYLFVYTPAGIQQVTLADSTFQNLLIAEDAWLDWGAGFAQNKKYLAYWIKTAQGTELWFTSLSQWQPQLILKLEDVAYDFATPIWGVNDRYLLFNLSVIDNSGPLEDLKTLQTYIIDMRTVELVNQSYWPGDCSILATSPHTNQLALWCYKVEEEANLHEFLVLEPDADPWGTQEPPDILIDDCLIYLICAWSQDGELAAYVVTEDNPDSLFYTMIEEPIPITLHDEHTRYYSFPAWSPNGQFLYYAGGCVGGGIQCPNVISIVNHEIIWRARAYDNWGEENINTAHIIWSPDSYYLALPIFVIADSGSKEQVLFFDIITQQEVSRIEGMGGVILDLVWVAD